MTAISAIISKDWIAAASDSLLTEYNHVSNTIKHLEFRKSKIVPIRQFKACAAYWGLAKIGNWRTYDFLKEKATEANNYTNFEEFANYICQELQTKLNRIRFQNSSDKGIGIHLIGYESINGMQIPELFLISNYTDPNYNETRELNVSRHLYGTLPEEFRNGETTLSDKQLKVKDFLDLRRLFIFNNGDPVMFNPAAKAIFEMFNSAKERHQLRQTNNYEEYMRLVSRPIEIIKKVQKDFFVNDYIRVGGKIHHLLITKRGDFLSDTGDNDL